MEKAIRTLLRLQGWKVYGVWDEGDRVVVRVGPAKRTAGCPHCGHRSGSQHARGRKRTLWHGMVGRRTVALLSRAPRLWCRACHKAFTMPLPGVARWQRRTQEAEVFCLLYTSDAADE